MTQQRYYNMWSKTTPKFSRIVFVVATLFLFNTLLLVTTASTTTTTLFIRAFTRTKIITKLQQQQEPKTITTNKFTNRRNVHLLYSSNDNNNNSNKNNRSNMKRPIMDTLATILFKAEEARINASSEIDEKGREGEPMEWSEKDSFANRFTELVASNSLGYQFKQLIADIVAGEYDVETVQEMVDSFIVNDNDDGNNKEEVVVAMFSFTTCPFCRRAKDYFDENGIPYRVMELDDLEGNRGNEIRAVLGRMTKRTSVPSIFIKGKPIGGLNDGMPGLLPLVESGELQKLLKR